MAGNCADRIESGLRSLGAARGLATNIFSCGGRGYEPRTTFCVYES